MVTSLYWLISVYRLYDGQPRSIAKLMMKGRLLQMHTTTERERYTSIWPWISFKRESRPGFHLNGAQDRVGVYTSGCLYNIQPSSPAFPGMMSGLLAILGCPLWHLFFLANFDLSLVRNILVGAPPGFSWLLLAPPCSSGLPPAPGSSWILAPPSFSRLLPGSPFLANFF